MAVFLAINFFFPKIVFKFKNGLMNFLLIFPLCLLFFFFFTPFIISFTNNLQETKDLKSSYYIVEKIYSYYEQQNIFPETLEKIDIKDDRVLNYEIKKQGKDFVLAIKSSNKKSNSFYSYCSSDIEEDCQDKNLKSYQVTKLKNNWTKFEYVD